jgi:hypothetical protein
MKKRPVFVLAMVVIVLVVLPISVRGDSLMHVGIGRGMRTGPGKDIDIGRGGYGESLMHVGIGRGIRTGPDKDIDIGRGAVYGRGTTSWLGGYTPYYPPTIDCTGALSMVSVWLGPLSMAGPIAVCRAVVMAGPMVVCRAVVMAGPIAVGRAVVMAGPMAVGQAVAMAVDRFIILSGVCAANYLCIDIDSTYYDHAVLVLKQPRSCCSAWVL